jgi:hypothetical protein
MIAVAFRIAVAYVLLRLTAHTALRITVLRYMLHYCGMLRITFAFRRYAAFRFAGSKA